MSRKRGPALYELISANQPQQASKPNSPQEHHQESDEDLKHNVLTPGRAIRMSVGSIGVMITMSIALIVISYTMGYRKGTAIAREDYSDRVFAELPDVKTTKVANVPVKKELPVVTVPKVTGKTTWGAIESDPRVSGSYYFTLMQTTREGAVQLAVFCREKGLETYAVSSNNTRLHRVVALPRFTTRNDANTTSVLSQIHAIGQQWAQTKNGRNGDLKDAYLVLHE